MAASDPRLRLDSHDHEGRDIDRSAAAQVCRRVLGAVTDGPHRRWLLFALLAAVYLPTANYAPPMINDNISMAAAAWSLGTTGSLDLSGLGLEAIHWGIELDDGRLYSNRFPGTFVLAAPLYRILPVEAWRPVGAEGIPLWPATLAAVLIAALAVVTLVEVLRVVTTPRRALTVGIVVGLATPFWSVAANELWTHGPAVLFLGLGLLAVARNRYAWAGAAFGYAILVRPTLVVVPLVVGLGAGLARRSLRPVMWIGVVSALGLGALSLYSQTLFGTWVPVAGYGPSRALSAIGASQTGFGGFTLWEQLFGTLFDTYRGVLVFSPFLLPLLPAVRAGWREADWWVRAAAVAGLAVWTVQLRANGFPGGTGFWGYRLAIEPLVLMAPLLTTAYVTRIQSVRLWKFAVLVTVVAAFAITLPGAVWFGSKAEPPRPQLVPIEGGRTTGNDSSTAMGPHLDRLVTGEGLVVASRTKVPSAADAQRTRWQQPSVRREVSVIDNAGTGTTGTGSQHGARTRTGFTPQDIPRG